MAVSVVGYMPLLGRLKYAHNFRTYQLWKLCRS
jgi:hypothetical protein